jgi:cell wall-associated NlpC family hydrolase
MSYNARHRKRKKRVVLVIGALLMTIGIVLAFTVVPSPAHAATAGESPGARALDWAEAHATGLPYIYGGTGPYGYDCSGLVYEAVLEADGITLPRDTYEMLAGSPHLEQIPLADAQRGDLLFYGSGHVEFDTIWYHMSFGAHDSGSSIGWITWGGSWVPTMALRVTG